MKPRTICWVAAAFILAAGAMWSSSILQSGEAEEDPAAARALMEATRHRASLLHQYGVAETALEETGRQRAAATEKAGRLQQEIQSFETALATPRELSDDQTASAREQLTILRVQLPQAQSKLAELDGQHTAQREALARLEAELNALDDTAAQSAEPLDALTRLRRFLHWGA